MTGLARSPLRALARSFTITIVALIAGLLMLPVGAAYAHEGGHAGIPELEKKLAAAMKDYNNAKGKLAASRHRQKKLDKEIKGLETKVDKLSGKIGELASAVYKGSRVGTVSALLDSSTPQDLATSMTTVEYLAHRDYVKIKDFVDSRDKLANKRYQLQLEMRKQRAALSKMDKRKKAALKALIAAGGGDPTGGPDGGAASAEPSPRNPDGSWPSESCSENDPTTDGCLTPRTLHALQEAREAGYTRYTACWRQASYGEHPKGRACDFSASAGGFEDHDAYGSDKQYGDNVAGWFVANADALGVMYIIWYRQIWEPGNGWSSYDGGGSPAADHTNHVHVSIQ